MGSVYEPPEIILEIFDEYRRAARLPMIERGALIRLFAQLDVPPEPVNDPAKVIPFPDRHGRSGETTG